MVYLWWWLVGDCIMVLHDVWLFIGWWWLIDGDGLIGWLLVWWRVWGWWLMMVNVMIIDEHDWLIESGWIRVHGWLRIDDWLVVVDGWWLLVMYRLMMFMMVMVLGVGWWCLVDYNQYYCIDVGWLMVSDCLLIDWLVDCWSWCLWWRWCMNMMCDDWWIC